ncbi:MAG TPA: methyltransferase domain-containing protein [Opitutaceae bacterium]|nr:methyltransferase domain-containing protein [Opitutaceae bacterium]
MPTWNSDQYLKFAAERTQPAVDLAARIALASPARVVDLGCGPGNSTAVLAHRWPQAALTGLDNSAAMLATARKEMASVAWIESDIAAWSAAPHDAANRFDLIFSNAALQWVPGHARVLPALFARVAAGGALAFQVPANFDAPPHRLMRELATSAPWRSHFPTLPREWHAHAAEFYYDTLAPLASRLDLWCTDYVHVLEGVDGIVEWYRGTGLRPWLDALPDEPTRTRFLAAYRARLVPYFPTRVDGRVLFPFRRLFVVAYR